jgi:hypothetical protein
LKKGTHSVPTKGTRRSEYQSHILFVVRVADMSRGSLTSRAGERATLLLAGDTHRRLY